MIWLKHPAAADYLLQEGYARFGTSRAFCSKFEQREGLDLCYNCNGYRHKQTNCTHKTKCGICSDPHNTRNCSQRTTPKCPACKGPHPIFDRKCRFRPKHAATDREQGMMGDKTRTRDEGASKDKGASKQRPTFGPALPPGMVREKRETSTDADADMVDA